MNDDRQEVVLEGLAGAMGGGGVAAVALVGGPVAAVLGGIAAEPVKLLLVGALRHLPRLWKQQARRGGDDVLMERLKRQPEAAALLVDAATAMARAYEEKIETIAQAVDQAMLHENNVRFDVESLIVRTIIGLDRPHVAILMELGDDYVHDAEMGSRLDKYAHVLPALFGELDRLGLTSTGPQEDPAHSGLYMMSGHKVTDLGREVRQRFQAGRPA